MKRFLTLLVCLLFLSSNVFSQDNREQQHLLDGTSMNYYYQNGSAVHVDFKEGAFHYKWITGPAEGTEGSSAYNSRKIDHKTYMVAFGNDVGTYVTIIFNFNQNVMYTSAILNPNTAEQAFIFDGGIIEQLTLKEK